MNLRTIVGTFTLVGTVFALAVSAALIWLTTVMHHSTATIADAAQSVQLAESAQARLLLHRRARDPLLRQQATQALLQRLHEARAYVSSAEEARALREAEAAVEAMRSETVEFDAAETRAYAALGEVVAINIAQSRDASTQVSRMDELANVVGLGGGAAAFLIAVGLLWWMRTRAFEPVFALAKTMERFARGDTSARAPEVGPGELREMTRHFNEMASAIAAQRHAHTAFLGGVAHDLRGPLQALRLAAGVVEDVDPELAERIERPITRLERMVGDLLDAAKIEAGQLALRMETYDARAPLRTVSEIFEDSSPSHTLSFELPSEPLYVRCDPMRLEQTLTNLVSNALKYSPDGGSVSVSLARSGAEVVFQVRDEGIGISAGDQRRLFEPFQRVGLSKESIPGVGLGLFVVRQIVEAHGGRIEVSSAPGRGSTFRVALPALLDAPNDPARSPKEA
jgi:two-component system sensor histidine kinase MtrB